MTPRRQRVKGAVGRWTLSLGVALALASPAFAYNLPAAKDGTTGNENFELLQKLSKGVAAIAKQANQALVSVSIYKTVRGMPNGMVDPFDFFFGPGGRQGGQDDGQIGRAHV